MQNYTLFIFIVFSPNLIQFNSIQESVVSIQLLNKSFTFSFCLSIFKLNTHDQWLFVCSDTVSHSQKWSNSMWKLYIMTTTTDTFPKYYVLPIVFFFCSFCSISSLNVWLNTNAGESRKWEGRQKVDTNRMLLVEGELDLIMIRCFNVNINDMIYANKCTSA